jgi:hypothetical protein
MGVVKEVRLDVVATVRPHQLVIQRLDLRFKTMVLLEELLVALLDILDSAVLFLHPVVVLL